MNITLVIIGVCVVASFYAWNNPEIHKKWMMNPYLVRQRGQVYRFITSGFIHGDYGHLFFNMFTLFFFGEALEYYYGIYFGKAGPFIVSGIFLVGVIVSDIPTYFKYKNLPHYNSLGASGGVSSLVFSSIMLSPVSNVCLYGVLCIPGFILGAGYLMYSVYKSKKGGDNINHSAHFYGALFGVAVTLLLIPGSFMNFVRQVSSWSIF